MAVFFLAHHRSCWLTRLEAGDLGNSSGEDVSVGGIWTRNKSKTLWSARKWTILLKFYWCDTVPYTNLSS